MTKLRSTFAEYGLGAPTGIDLPLESTGFLPEEYSTANFITNAFGQFDNYTPMQMAQYPLPLRIMEHGFLHTSLREFMGIMTKVVWEN